ncbi:hypothetical protein VTH06DRAFT_5175 [Thermothelomyces fergusii]
MDHSHRSVPGLQGLSPAEAEAKMKEQAAIQAMMANAIAAGAFDDEDAEAVKNLDDLGGGRIYDNASTHRSRERRVFDVTMRILEQRSSGPARQREESAAENWQNRQNMNEAVTASPVRANNRRPRPAAINPITRPARPRPAPVVSSLPVSIPEAAPIPDTALHFEVPNVVFKTEASFLSRDVQPAMRAVVVLSAAKRPELGFFIVSLFGRKYCEWAMSAWYDYSTGVDNLLGVIFEDGSTFHSYQIFFDTLSDLTAFVESVRSILAEKYMALVDSASASTSTPPSVAASSGLAYAGTRTDQAAGDARLQNTPVGTQVARSTAPAIHCPAANSKPHADAKPSVTRKSVVDSKPTLARTASPPGSVAPASRGPAAVLPAESRCVGEDASSGDATAGSHGNTVSMPQGPRQQSTLDRQVSVQEAPKMKHAAVGTVTDGHEAGAAGLLSTLQSYRHSDSADIDESSMRVFRNIVSATARLFFQFFCFSEVAGRTRTLEELDQTARGVKVGFLEHTVKSARAQGFSERQVQAIRDEITRVFESELAAKLNAQRNASKSRHTYGLDELLSMRDRAVEPPGGLSDMSSMPEPGSGSLQGSSMPRDVPAFPRQVVAACGADKEGNERDTNSHKPQIARVRDAMDWVLGKTATSKPDNREPRAESDEGQATVRDVEKKGGSGEKGLQGSRWASGASVIKAANLFTGPRYEKGWSKRTCLEELGQLQPQDKVTTATEDLTDLYFPLPEDTDMEGEAVKARKPDGDGDRVPAAASSRSGASTPKRHDKVETVTAGTPRASLRSPAAPQSKPDRPPPSTEQWGFAARTLREVCSQPASAAAQRVSQGAQARVRGLAASRHSAGTGPSSSGNFNLYTPPSARR